MNSDSQDSSAQDGSSEKVPAVDKDVALSPGFETALEATIAFALDTFKQQIETQQLYYHGLDHVEGVARRARLIFDTVVPFYQQAGYVPDIAWNRQRDLLQLSAIAHDMLQIFLPQSSPHMPRQRQSGHSEQATVERLLTFIEQINQRQQTLVPATAADVTVAPQLAFTAKDVALLQEAVEATVCQYDSTDGSIYQPLLYARHRGDRSLSLVARALALADLGTLGIEGISAYQREGCLLLLEENLDIVPFLHSELSQHGSISDEPRANTAAFSEDFKENLRQRLLKRARFDVSFAKGRLARLDAELEGLPIAAIAALKQQVFTYLTPAIIQQIVAITPSADDTPLSELLGYFHFDTLDI